LKKSIENTNININIISQSLRRNLRRKLKRRMMMIKIQIQDNILKKCNLSFKRRSLMIKNLKKNQQ